MAAWRLSELIDGSEEHKDELREEIYAAVDETVRAGNFHAVYAGGLTKEELDMERAQTELEEAGEGLSLCLRVRETTPRPIN